MDPRKELSQLLQEIMSTAQHSEETLKRIKELMQELIKVNQKRKPNTSASETQADPLTAIANGLNQKGTDLAKQTKNIAKMRQKLASIQEGEVPTKKAKQVISSSLDKLDKDTDYLKRIQGDLQQKVDLITPQRPLTQKDHVEKMQKQLKAFEGSIDALYSEHNKLKQQASLGVKTEDKPSGPKLR